jgi:DNA-binding SARP family transcriptional activator
MSNPSLRIAILGPPEIRLGEIELATFLSTKATALLIFLALHPKEAHSRNRIANLLWAGQSSGRKNLRDVLPQLRRYLGDYLHITYSHVSFRPVQPYWVDAEVLQSLMADQSVTGDPELLDQVLDLYRGDFLDGFHVRNAPDFDNWVSIRREQLHVTAMRGLERLAEICIQQQRLERGLAAADRLLHMEPWHERGHYLRMRILALSGKRGVALAQYRTCHEILADELGVEPGKEITDLYEAIRSDNFGTSPVSTPVSSPLPPAPSLVGQGTPGAPLKDPPLPFKIATIPQPPPLIGRQSSLQTLSGWLQNDATRLILISGLAGVGKSALAATLARKSDCDFVLWSSLRAGLPSAQRIAAWLHMAGEPVSVPSLADPSSAPRDATDMLLALLNRRRCLLILDGLEHLALAGRKNGSGESVSGRLGSREDAGEVYSFFGKLVEVAHRSTVLVTAWDRPAFMNRWIQRPSVAVQELRLEGLSQEESQTLLRQEALQAEDEVLGHLGTAYGGNPTALLTVAQSIHDLYNGDAAAFLSDGVPAVDAIHWDLAQQIGQLSQAEQCALNWLSLLAAPVGWHQIRQRMRPQPDQSLFLQLSRSLQQRSLVNVEAGQVSVPEIVARYNITRLAEQIYQEICLLSAKAADLQQEAEQGRQDARASRSRLAYEFNHACLNRFDLGLPLFPAAESGNSLRTPRPFASTAFACATAILERLIGHWGFQWTERHLRLLMMLMLNPGMDFPGYISGNISLLLDLHAS